jgi:hypothetical protein
MSDLTPVQQRLRSRIEPALLEPPRHNPGARDGQVE